MRTIQNKRILNKTHTAKSRSLSRRNAETPARYTGTNADTIYRYLLEDNNLFHLFYGHGTTAEKAKGRRLWNKALKIASQNKQQKSSNFSKNSTDKYIIIDALYKPHGSVSTNYDSLQKIADRHNEKYDSKWFVVEVKDLQKTTGVMKEFLKNPARSEKAVNATWIKNRIAEWKERLAEATTPAYKRAVVKQINFLQKELDKLQKSKNTTTRKNARTTYLADSLQEMNNTLKSVAKDHVKGETVAFIVKDKSITWRKGEGTKWSVVNQRVLNSKANNKKPKSYFAKVWALPGKTLIGGTKTNTSSRFESRQDAVSWVWSLLEIAGNNIGRQEIIPSEKLPEIKKSFNKTQYGTQQNTLSKYGIWDAQTGMRYRDVLLPKNFSGMVLDKAMRNNGEYIDKSTYSIKKIDTDTFNVFEKGEHVFLIRKVRENKTQYGTQQLNDLSQAFQGKRSGTAFYANAPDEMPKDTSRLGQLRYIKVQGNNGKFYEIELPKSADAWAVADLRKNVWLIGEDARVKNLKLPKKNEYKKLGVLRQGDYLTDKAHIENNNLIHYFHKFGEVDKQYPTVLLNHDGFILLVGGNYDIGEDGIEN